METVKSLLADLKSVWRGVLGFLACVALLLAPPWAVLEALEVPPYTLVSLVVPLAWILYLLVGVALVDDCKMYMRYLARVTIWPLTLFSRRRGV